MSKNINGTDDNDTLTGTACGDQISGRDGNDTIFGLAGNDDLKGNDGNDKIDGGAGNDKIDGGKGIDTAIYHGNFADFSITFKNNGNTDLTVAGKTSATLAANGIDTLKDIEFLQFNDGTFNVATRTFTAN